MSQDTIRRAALLIETLDRHAADALLERLPAEQAAAIREAVIGLGEVDESQQQEALEDFLHPPPASTESSEPTTAAPLRESLPESVVLQDLLALGEETIAVALLHERASVVAGLLACLPQGRAATLLRLLPDPLQTRVVLTLGQGVQPQLEAAEAIAEWICDRHALRQNQPRPGLRHRDALQAILDAVPAHEREEMLRSLGNENPLLAQRLARDATSASDDCYC